MNPQLSCDKSATQTLRMSPAQGRNWTLNFHSKKMNDQAHGFMAPCINDWVPPQKERKQNQLNTRPSAVYKYVHSVHNTNCCHQKLKYITERHQNIVFYSQGKFNPLSQNQIHAFQRWQERTEKVHNSCYNHFPCRTMLWHGPTSQLNYKHENLAWCGL